MLTSIFIILVFAGTLNPALQDRFGRPKKDVSTIIHILNDLLCAEPRAQCKSSCGCSPTSSVMTEKIKASSTPEDTPSTSSSFMGLGSSVLNNVEDITRFGTATFIPVNVNEQNGEYRIVALFSEGSGQI